MANNDDDSSMLSIKCDCACEIQTKMRVLMIENSKECKSIGSHRKDQEKAKACNHHPLMYKLNIKQSRIAIVIFFTKTSLSKSGFIELSIEHLMLLFALSTVQMDIFDVVTMNEILNCILSILIS